MKFRIFLEFWFLPLLGIQRVKSQNTHLCQWKSKNKGLVLLKTPSKSTSTARLLNNTWLFTTGGQDGNGLQLWKNYEYKYMKIIYVKKMCHFFFLSSLLCLEKNCLKLIMICSPYKKHFTWYLSLCVLVTFLFMRKSTEF